jgi:hypothetical protein
MFIGAPNGASSSAVSYKLGVSTSTPSPSPTATPSGSGYTVSKTTSLSAGGDFGSDVAVSKYHTIVGAKGSKKAYIYGLENGKWSTTASATLDGFTSETGFGATVAIACSTASSSYAIVGADGAKKAFIFKYTGGAWGVEAVATIDRYTGDAAFGGEVAIASSSPSSGFAMIGSGSSTAGNAYIFEMTGGAWGTTATATIDGYKSEEGFGSSLSITDNAAVVGASGAGKAFVFPRDSKGTWSKAASVTLFDLNGNSSGFGSMVEMTPYSMIVGAPSGGNAYIYALGVDGSWSNTPAMTIKAPPSSVSIASASSTSGYAAVGSTAGKSVHIYECTGRQWSLASVVKGDSSFGSSVSISETGALFVGAPNGASSSASAFSVGTGTSKVKYTVSKATSLSADGDFGSDVAVSHYWTIIGAKGAKKAYIYGLAKDGSWSSTAAATIGGFTSEGGFGSAVAIDGNLPSSGSAIVGADGAKKAFVFKCTDGKWGVDKAATAIIDAYTGDNAFGGAVDITTSSPVTGFAMVGGGSSTAGNVYIFSMKGGVWGTKAVKKIDGYTGEAGFGSSLSITDDYAVVGAPGAGKAFVFGLGSDGTWSSSAMLDIDGYTLDEGFGSMVEISPNAMIIGAPKSEKAFIFGMKDDGTWSKTDSMQISVNPSAVAIASGTSGSGYAIVGSSNKSSAYVYECHGKSWSLVATVKDDSSTSFASSVAISESGAVFIGAPNGDSSSAVAYDVAASEVETIASSPLVAFEVSNLASLKAGGNFGASVSVSDHYTAIGAPDAKQVYIYGLDYTDLTSKSGSSPAIILDSLEAGFGSAVAITSSSAKNAYVIVGANDAKKAFVFECTNGQWIKDPKATIDAYTGNAAFGGMVSLTTSSPTSGYAIIGGGSSTAAANAYIFSMVGGVWDTKAAATIDAYSGEKGFGSSVSISGDYAVVGAAGAGKAFVFERDGKKGTWSTKAVTSLDGHQSEAGFGGMVEITPNMMIVGAAQAEKAFIFTPNAAGMFSPIATKTINKPATSVSIASSSSGNGYAMVGSDAARAAYIYECFDGKWSDAPTTLSGYSGSFGSSVSISETGYAVVGAPRGSASSSVVFAVAPDGISLERATVKNPPMALSTIENTVMLTTEGDFGTDVSASPYYSIVGDKSSKTVYIYHNGDWTASKRSSISRKAEAGFGGAVAITSSSLSSGYAIVGADGAKKAFIYKCTNGQWSKNPDAIVYGQPGDAAFGGSVALTSDSPAIGFAVVGGGTNQGSNVYIYGMSNGVWSTKPAAKLDGYGGEAGFGSSVSITGKYAVVGASGAAKAFVFKLESTGWTTQALTTIDGYTSEARFGSMVEISPFHMIVGAEGQQSSSGAKKHCKAYIFEMDVSRALWSTKAAETIPMCPSSVSIVGETDTEAYAVVGSEASKSVAVYERSVSKWSLSSTLTGDPQDSGFGKSVSIAENGNLLVGIPSGNKTGVFAVATKPIEIAYNATSIDDITSQSLTHLEQFGSSVSASSFYGIVSAYGASTAYIYAAIPRLDAWILDETLDGYTGEAGFGRSVAISSISKKDAFAIVGADTSKKAFIFKCTYGEWNATAVATIGGYSGETAFGGSVAIRSKSPAGGFAMIAGGAGVTSKVYIFAMSSNGEWGTEATATIDGYGAVTEFGSSVSITDNYAVVGAPGAAKAFVFGIGSDGTWGTQAITTIDAYASEITFGSWVQMSHHAMIVGSPQMEKTYIFGMNKDGSWRTSAVRTINAASSSASIATSSSLSGYAVVGSEQTSSVHVLECTGGVWKNVSEVDGTSLGSTFGGSVAITEDGSVFVGAPKGGNSSTVVFSVRTSVDFVGMPVVSPINGPTTTVSAFARAAEEDSFGSEVANSAYHLIVGASSANKAYIYELAPGGSWSSTAAITLDSYALVDGFGSSVAITSSSASSGYAIVGASGAKKAFVFTCTNGQWNATASTVIDGYTSKAAFGGAVSITSSSASSGFAIIGGGSLTTAEDAFIFEMEDGSWGSTAVATIDQKAGESMVGEAGFGSSVSISDNYAVVGAAGSGKAFVFNIGSDGTWGTTAAAVLTGTGLKEANFGSMVATSPYAIIVGSPLAKKVYMFTPYGALRHYAKFNGAPSSVSIVGTSYTRGYAVIGSKTENAAWVYESLGGAWTRAATINGDTVEPTFGQSVSISQTGYAVVGAPATKSIWAFTVEETVKAYVNDAATAEFSPMDGDFGSSLSTSQHYAIVGAKKAKKAYIYEQIGSEWSTSAKVTLDYSKGGYDGFGSSVAIASNSPSSAYAIVGADGAKKALIFKCTACQRRECRGGQWDTAAVATIDAYTGDATFGGTVAIASSSPASGFAMVGGDASTAANAYIFEMDGGVWGTKAAKTIDGYKGEAGWGSSLSMTENTAVVGASGAGKAFVFSLDDNGSWDSTASTTIAGYSSEAGFGSYVDISDYWMIVGAPAAKKVFIFDKTGDGSWSSTAVQTINKASTSVSIASSSATAGYAVIGSSRSAVVYTYKPAESSWQQVPSEVTGGDFGPSFGSSVGITASGALFVGAPNGAKSAAFAYLVQPASAKPELTIKKDVGAAATTYQRATLAAYGNVGATVSASNYHAIVGAKNSRKAYFYGQGAGGWNTNEVAIVDGFTSEAGFGSAVSISSGASSSYAIVGASGVKKAFIFKYSGGKWDTKAPTTIDAYTSEPAFAGSVSIASSSPASGFALVGGGTSTDLGNKVYIFQMEDGSWGTTAAATFAPADNTTLGFGSSVSISDNYALVGSAGSSKAFMYSLKSDGKWSAYPTVFDRYTKTPGFGSMVEVSSYAFIVGSPTKVFLFHMMHDGSWSTKAREFVEVRSSSISITSTVPGNGFAVIGVADENTALVLECDRGIWRKSSTIDGGASASALGSSVSMTSGGYAFVGAPNGPLSTTVIFNIEPKAVKYNATVVRNGQSTNHFGASVTGNYHTALVGGLEASEVYNYAKWTTGNKTTWTEMPVHTISSVGDDYKSLSVSTSPAVLSFAIIGAQSENKVRIFRCTTGCETTAAATIDGYTSDAAFGGSVAITSSSTASGFAIVGGGSGTGDKNKVYIFQMSGGAWNTSASATIDGAGIIGFGSSVSITDNYALVGASGAAKAFLYELKSDGTWDTTPKLSIQHAANNTGFGSMVEISPYSIIVGAPAAKQVFIYHRKGDGSWSQTADKQILCQATPTSVSIASAQPTSGFAMIGMASLDVTDIYAYGNSMWQDPVQLRGADLNANGLGSSVKITSSGYAFVGAPDTNRFIITKVKDASERILSNSSIIRFDMHKKHVVPAPTPPTPATPAPTPTPPTSIKDTQDISYGSSCGAMPYAQLKAYRVAYALILGIWNIDEDLEILFHKIVNECVDKASSRREPDSYRDQDHGTSHANYNVRYTATYPESSADSVAAARATLAADPAATISNQLTSMLNDPDYSTGLLSDIANNDTLREITFSGASNITVAAPICRGGNCNEFNRANGIDEYNGVSKEGVGTGTWAVLGLLAAAYAAVYWAAVYGGHDAGWFWFCGFGTLLASQLVGVISYLGKYHAQRDEAAVLTPIVFFLPSVDPLFSVLSARDDADVRFLGISNLSMSTNALYLYLALLASTVFFLIYLLRSWLHKSQPETPESFKDVEMEDTPGTFMSMTGVAADGEDEEQFDEKSPLSDRNGKPSALTKVSSAAQSAYPVAVYWGIALYVVSHAGLSLGSLYTIVFTNEAQTILAAFAYIVLIVVCMAPVILLVVSLWAVPNMKRDRRERATGPHKWVECQDPVTQVLFYYNFVTGETTREVPANWEPRTDGVEARTWEERHGLQGLLGSIEASNTAVCFLPLYLMAVLIDAAMVVAFWNNDAHWTGFVMLSLHCFLTVYFALAQPLVDGEGNKDTWPNYAGIGSLVLMTIAILFLAIDASTQHNDEADSAQWDGGRWANVSAFWLTFTIFAALSVALVPIVLFFMYLTRYEKKGKSIDGTPGKMVDDEDLDVPGVDYDMQVVANPAAHATHHHQAHTAMVLDVDDVPIDVDADQEGELDLMEAGVPAPVPVAVAKEQEEKKDLSNVHLTGPCAHAFRTLRKETHEVGERTADSGHDDNFVVIEELIEYLYNVPDYRYRPKGLKEYNEAQAKKVRTRLHKMDTDGNGTLNIAEFKAWWESHDNEVPNEVSTEGGAEGGAEGCV